MRVEVRLKADAIYEKAYTDDFIKRDLKQEIGCCSVFYDSIEVKVIREGADDEQAVEESNSDTN